MSSEPELRAPSAPPFGRIDFERILPILPQIIDSLSDAVLVVDRAQRVVAANRRYAEVFGRDEGALASSVCTKAIDCPERASGVEPDHCPTCAVLELRRTVRRLRVVPGPTGAQRRWEGTFNPVAGRGGEISHVVEVWRDVTERTRLESQLGHSERLASLGILAAGVAHEINNPLAAILAGVESLQRWLGSKPCIAAQDERAEEAREILQLLERESRRVQETTDKLMLLAQPYSVAPVLVDLNRAVSDLVRLLQYQTQRQGVVVTEVLDPALPTVWARETGIRSIVMNLLMNAVQAMPDGGKLVIRTARRGTGAVTLVIEDTGPGIAPEHFDRIWDPFFTTKPAGQGTGLGLSITQRIVTRHGGHVHAENLLAGGARFVVELPVEGPGGEAGG